MLSVTRSLVVIVLYLTLSVLVFSQSTPASVPEPEVIYGASSVEWPTSVPDAPVLLTISGPAGFYLRQENPAGTWGRFSLVDEQGQMRPDGVYKWELVSQAGWDDAAHATQSGWFQIQNGKVVAEGAGETQPVVVEEQASGNSLYVDSQGRVGLGTSVPASQLHLRGILPAVTLEDTTSGGGAFTWRGLEKGDGSLGLFDKAGQARWLVDSEGRIGINTTKPTSALTVDGYIEATKGFLVNGKPVGIGFGLIGGSQPLSGTEGSSNNYFGTGAGGASGTANSFFGAYAGDLNTGSYNNFFGASAGSANTGNYNNFFGWGAGGSNTTGMGNSFFGDLAGRYNISGNDNSFFGRQAGNFNTASGNSFFGAYAGHSNTAAVDNSFFGYEAGRLNITGFSNSFFGRSAGYSNTGNYNTFFGFQAGYSNTGSAGNSFFGDRAGRASTGVANSFFGGSAGFLNTSGSTNSFFGVAAGYRNTMGNNNSFFGNNAGASNTIENNNTFIGANSDGVAGITNATALGSRAKVSASNSLVLGSIAGESGATSYVNVGVGTTTPYYSIHVVRTGANAAVVTQRTDGAANYMNASATFANFGSVNNFPLRLMVNGTWRMRLDLDNSLSMVNGASCTAGGVWTNGSSREYKENISALSSEEAMETLDGLSPVKFNYKADQTETYVGFIAEDVPDLVATNDRKSLSPMDIVAVLARVVQEQQKTIEDQQKAFDSLKAEVETLKALLQGR